MDFGFVTVPSIVVICYFTGMIMKVLPINSRFIPIICGILGGVLGVVAMLVIPNILDSDLLSAIAIGIGSGLAATGAHQIGVQLREDQKTDEKVEKL